MDSDFKKSPLHQPSMLFVGTPSGALCVNMDTGGITPCPLQVAPALRTRQKKGPSGWPKK